MFAGTETLSLRLRANRNTKFERGGPSLNLGGAVEPEGSGVVQRESSHIRYNLFAGTEALSLSIYGPIAMQIFAWGPSPNMGGRGGDGGSSVVPRESPS